jgi:hypothetical protein
MNMFAEYGDVGIGRWKARSVAGWKRYARNVKSSVIINNAALKAVVANDNNGFTPGIPRYIVSIHDTGRGFLGGSIVSVSISVSTIVLCGPSPTISMMSVVSTDTTGSDGSRSRYRRRMKERIN